MAAANSAQHPAIQGAGTIYPTPNAANKPDPKSTYKIVFPLAAGPESEGKVNEGLEQLAQTVNLYANAGVPSDHVKIVGVVTLHGLGMLLTNKAYQQAYDTDNPNLKIIKQLQEKGVKFYVDGQTMARLEHKYSALKDSDFIDSVPKTYSGITAIIGLLQNGYALMMLPEFQGNVHPEFFKKTLKQLNIYH
jgi:intracellular sulfur oxidation DsrE/DsrF family protein